MPSEPIHATAATAPPAGAPGPTPDEVLRVPLGWRSGGSPVLLDLSPAPDGSERHGLLAGAFGSGKSELVATIVLGLAAAYSAERVNVALVDRYRPTASIAALAGLPHVAAMMHELLEDPLGTVGIDLMTQALDAELARRAGLLAATGFRTAVEYRRARHVAAALPPLPTLLVICEETWDLLTFTSTDFFSRAGRFAGPLGVGLLFVDRDRNFGTGTTRELLRAVGSHLTYRIVLRTDSRYESEHLLGVPVAAELPQPPQYGFLRVGDRPPERFQLAYPLRPRDPEPWNPDPGRPVATRPDPLERFVTTRAAMEPATRRIWLPPPPNPPVLDELMGPLDEIPGRGLSTTDPRQIGGLSAPVGLVDDLRWQRRYPLWLRLDRHFVVVGGRKSGRSTMLRTLAVGLALTHTPTEVTLYCLDLDGGQLVDLARLPHTAAVVDGSDPGAVRQTVRALAALLAERERRSGSAPAGSGGTLEGMPGPAEVPDPEPTGHVFLLIDNWDVVGKDQPLLGLMLIDLVDRGAAHRIHVATTAGSWSEVPAPAPARFGCWLELRLGGRASSAVGTAATVAVPWDQRGSGITPEGTPFRTAVLEPAGGPGDLVDRIAGAWRTATGPPDSRPVS